MGTVAAQAEKHIDASPAKIYAILSDRDRRREILPDAFQDVRSEGPDTVAFTLKTGGRERAYRMQQERTQPGRIFTERDLDSSLVTVFTINPEGSGSHVTIRTTWQGAGGVGGFFERTFAPRVLRRLYEQELTNLQKAATRST